MNIRTDYLEALKRQQELNRKNSSPATGALSGEDSFAALFSQEIGQSGEAELEGLAGEQALTTGRSTTRTAGLDASMLAAALGETSAASETEEAALLDTITGQASGLLDSWDQYAKALSSGDSQRGIWKMLSSMDDQVKALRGNLKGLAGGNADLESMTNELEVMSATEKFKFNRGDYA